MRVSGKQPQASARCIVVKGCLRLHIRRARLLRKGNWERYAYRRRCEVFLQGVRGKLLAQTGAVQYTSRAVVRLDFKVVGISTLLYP